MITTSFKSSVSKNWRFKTTCKSGHKKTDMGCFVATKCPAPPPQLSQINIQEIENGSEYKTTCVDTILHIHPANFDQKSGFQTASSVATWPQRYMTKNYAGTIDIIQQH